MGGEELGGLASNGLIIDQLREEVKSLQCFWVVVFFKQIDD